MRLTLNTTIGGKGISGTLIRTGNGEPSYEETLDAAKAGTLTGRTDANTGVATLTSNPSPAIVSTDVVDVFWADGIRRGMVATVAALVVSLEGGAGDDLPATTTPLTVCKQQVLNIDIAGATIKACHASSSRRGSVQLQQEAGTVIASQDYGRAGGLGTGNDGEGFPFYISDLGMTNPFTGVDVGKVILSNGSAAGSCLFKIGFVVDA